MVLESALNLQDDPALPSMRLWLDEVAAGTGLDVTLFDAAIRTVYTSDYGVSLLVAPLLEEALQEGEIPDIELHLHGRLAVVRPLRLAGWDDVRYLSVASTRRRLEVEIVSIGPWFVVTVLAGLGIVLLISYRVVDGINAPLRHLQLAATRFAEGDLGYRCFLPEPVEFARLAETMNSMASQLTARIEAIRSQRKQLEAILGSMVEGVVLIDAQLRVQSMNVAARKLFGVASIKTEFGEPRTLLEVIRNSDIYNFIRHTMETEVAQEHNVVIYTNPPRYMQIHGTVVTIGEERGVLVVLNDITRLQELEMVRKEFVANVSHELKTPITSILGFVETLVDGALDEPEEATRFLEIITKQAHRLSAIIEDLLQLSRLEQGKESIATERVRAEDIVAAVRRTIQSRADEKSIALRDHYRGSTEITVNGSLIEQALTNLVDNAIKYSQSGATVDVTFENRPHRLLITVSDNGPGIPEADQPRLFERFFRVDKARSRTLGGTGLGLAIVKHIVQAHGGTVAVQSAPGRGASFFLAIPRPE